VRGLGHTIALVDTVCICAWCRRMCTGSALDLTA
jgi:hypothetical protein